MTEEQNAGGGILVNAAKKIGRTVGKAAAMVGADHAEAPQAQPASRKGKLAKKNKHRLPRREKKALARGRKQPA